MPGTFIALEGPDGVGKTALARLLAPAAYDDVAPGAPPAAPGPLVYVSKRQVPAGSLYAAGLMEHLAAMLWHSGDDPVLPDSFWVGLQSSWFTASYAAVLSPLLEAGHDVLTDGWIYKLCSKLLLQGWSQSELDAVFGRVPAPDAVILLTADIPSLFGRRDWRLAELGMHVGYAELGRQSFIDYQTAGLHRLQDMARRHGWPVVPLDTVSTPAQSAARIAPVIDKIRARTPAGAGQGAGR